MHGDEVHGKCWGRDHAWKKKCLENDVVLEQRKCNGDNSWVFFYAMNVYWNSKTSQKKNLPGASPSLVFFFSFLFLPFSFSLSLFPKIDPLQECSVFSKRSPVPPFFSIYIFYFLLLFSNLSGYYYYYFYFFKSKWFRAVNKSLTPSLCYYFF